MAGRDDGKPGEAASLDRRFQALRQGAEASDPVLGLDGPVGMAVLALLSLHPLAYGLRWLGLLPAGLPHVLVLPLGALPMWLWPALFVAAFAAQVFRPLAPVLLVGSGVWWSWTLLALAGQAGLVAAQVAGPPLP